MKIDAVKWAGVLYFLRPQPASCEVLNDISGDLV